MHWLVRLGFLLCLRRRWRIRGRGAGRQFFPQTLLLVAQAVDLLRHFADLLVESVPRIAGGLVVPVTSSPLRVGGVLRSHAGYRYGFEFVDLNPDQREIINKTCRTLASLRPGLG
jgi:hypothetical protein